MGGSLVGNPHSEGVISFKRMNFCSLDFSVIPEELHTSLEVCQIKAFEVCQIKGQG